jgi:hypothetical protein
MPGRGSICLELLQVWWTFGFEGFMRQIKLSGREIAVMKAIDFSTGTSGAEALEHTRLAREDLVDIVNGLMEVGYVECTPLRERVDEGCLDETIFEVNPSYALSLREALVKRW